MPRIRNPRMVSVVDLIGRKIADSQSCSLSPALISLVIQAGNKPFSVVNSVADSDLTTSKKSGKNSSIARSVAIRVGILGAELTRTSPSRVQFFRFWLCSEDSESVSFTSPPAEYSMPNGKSRWSASRPSNSCDQKSFGSLEEAMNCPSRSKKAIRLSAMTCRVVSNTGL